MRSWTVTSMFATSERFFALANIDAVHAFDRSATKLAGFTEAITCLKALIANDRRDEAGHEMSLVIFVLARRMSRFHTRLVFSSAELLRLLQSSASLPFAARNSAGRTSDDSKLAPRVRHLERLAARTDIAFVVSIHLLNCSGAAAVARRAEIFTSERFVSRNV